MSEHDKGPLHVAKAVVLSDGGEDWGIVDPSGRIIGEAYQVVGVDETRSAEANARLWAASPEMLRALEAADKKFKNTPGSPDGADWLTLARLAIAKATRAG